MFEDLFTEIGGMVCGQAIEGVAGRAGGYGKKLLVIDWPMIFVFINRVKGDRHLGAAVFEAPKDGRGSTVFRQGGGMAVDRHLAWQGEDVGRKESIEANAKQDIDRTFFEFFNG